MRLSRREFVLAGMGLVAGGCAPTQPVAGLPKPDWPDLRDRPVPYQRNRTLKRPIQNAAMSRPKGSVLIGPLYAIPRSSWARGAAIKRKFNRMGGIQRITVHHEGHTPVHFVDRGSSADRMDTIRKWHQQRGWADIGYHFVIDRAGRIWEGRALRYQGAHVSQNNEHNLGVMVLGNFDEQGPSDRQRVVLNDTLRRAMRYYRVPTRRVFTHRELMPTTCPGYGLQRHMVAARSGSVLG